MLDQFARLTEKRFRPLKDNNEAPQTSRHLSEIGLKKKWCHVIAKGHEIDSEKTPNRRYDRNLSK